jgi:hypothetical protein
MILHFKYDYSNDYEKLLLQCPIHLLLHFYSLPSVAPSPSHVYHVLVTPPLLLATRKQSTELINQNESNPGLRKQSVLLGTLELGRRETE